MIFDVFFFFQAEDGIRAGHVTGVQTCALPISGGLQVEQGGRDDQEVADLVQVPAVGARRDVGDELVGDLGEGDFGNVELVLGDQREQQVERALEHV